MEENKREDEGISLIELIHIIFRRKWILLGVTLGIFIFSIVFSSVILNRNKEYYSVTFSLEYPESSNYKYPDGTSFNYRKIISYDNLVIAKESNQKYKNIDVDSLFETNSIQIAELTKTVNGNTVPSGEYTLAAKAKFFNSRDVAKEFLRDLTNVPIVKVNEIIANLDYDSNLLNYSNSTVYESQIDYLIAQRDFIINGYNNLINYFSSGLMVSSIKDDEVH